MKVGKVIGHPVPIEKENKNKNRKNRINNASRMPRVDQLFDEDTSKRLGFCYIKIYPDVN